MKRISSFLILVIFMSCFLFQPITANAANISDTDSFTKVFFYSSGGFCSITVDVTYAENYTSNGTYNTYNERSKSMLVSKTYSGSEPRAILGNVGHSNGTIFQTWQQREIMYPINWQSGCLYVNNQSVTYSMTTNVTGTLAYMLTCDDAIVPTVPYSITLQL